MENDKLNKRLALKAKYPELIQCSIDIGPGWLPLLERCCEELMLLQDPKKQMYKGLRMTIVQVKEKFGLLIIHVLGGDQKAKSEIINKYTRNSSNVCEECGKPGTQENMRGWITTLCKECFEERKQQAVDGYSQL